MMRVGVIGTGGISGVHLRYLASRDDVEIASLCDLDDARAAEKAKQFGGKVYTDYRAMIEKENLDAAWLCTTPQARGEPLVFCAEAGLPVMCEKPVERDAEKAREIARALADRDAKVQIGYLFRSIPAAQRLRELLADDAARAVSSIYFCPMSLKQTLRPWFYDKALSGGGLVDQATHNFDLLRYLLGEVQIDSIVGVGSNPRRAKEPGYTIEEVISVGFRFESGAVCSHTHSWLADAWRNEIAVSGERRFYRLQLSKGSLTVEENGQSETFQPEVARPGHDYQNERFLEMVASGDFSKNPCDYADGARTLEMTLRCNDVVEPGRD